MRVTSLGRNTRLTRILGFAVKGQHCFVTALFYCDHLGIIGVPVRFLIDTGNVHTALTEATAKRLRIDLTKLYSEEHKIKVSGIGGSAEGYQLANVRFVFKDEDGAPVEEKLQFVYILKFPTPRNDEERKALGLIPDLLGLDIIRRFSFRFEKNLVYLER